MAINDETAASNELITSAKWNNLNADVQNDVDDIHEQYRKESDSLDLSDLIDKSVNIQTGSDTQSRTLNAASGNSAYERTSYVKTITFPTVFLTTIPKIFLTVNTTTHVSDGNWSPSTYTTKANSITLTDFSLTVIIDFYYIFSGSPPATALSGSVTIDWFAIQV